MDTPVAAVHTAGVPVNPLDRRDSGRRIVDAHVHLFDHTANRHEFLERRDQTFETLIGDYAALPRTYLVDDYLRDSSSRRVEGIVWHEFLSEDPVREAQWGQALADASPIPHAVVALVEFHDPALEERLDAYRSMRNVTAVRQHLAWDPTDPLRRFAARPDLLTDPAWRAGLARLGGWDVACGLEVFAHQLPELLDVVRLHPDIRFTMAVMGWPLDLTADGQTRWRGDVAEISRCENVCASISAVRVRPRKGLDGRRRAAVGRDDHRALRPRALHARQPSADLAPLIRLRASLRRLRRLLADLSPADQDSLFGATATSWFGFDRLAPPARDGGAAPDVTRSSPRA